MKVKAKNYMEDVETLEWISVNVPKQEESAFIRNAVKKEIERIKKKK